MGIFSDSKYDFNSGKGESYYHIVDFLPYTKYDKPIGPVKPINIENIKKNEELINDIEKTMRSKSTNTYIYTERIMHILYMKKNIKSRR